MTKLNQIVAIEKTVKTNTNRDITDLYQLLQKPQLMSGITRNYRPKDEDGDQLPSESTLVQVRTDKVLDDLGKHFTRLMDVVLTKDTANMEAKANIVVDGQTLAEDVPVSFLLFLEKQLTDFFTIVKKLPVLDQAEEWTFDENEGVYKTGVIETNRTKKVPRNHVKAPATDKHPAQVEMYFEDVPVGTWQTVKLSGATANTRRQELLERIMTMQKAVKFAREQANSIEITDKKIGEAIFDYLLA